MTTIAPLDIQASRLTVLGTPGVGRLGIFVVFTLTTLLATSGGQAAQDAQTAGAKVGSESSLKRSAAGLATPDNSVNESVQIKRGAFRATPEDRNWTLNLYVENDLFAQTDRDYTNGVRVSLVSPDLVDYIEDETLPSWMRRLNKKLRFFRENDDALQRNLSISLGQTIYTPRNREASELLLNDRPYAGWLFARAGYQTRSDRQLDTLEISLGVVGPAALGQEAQDFVHDLRDFERFNGWDNQLENEAGLLLLWEQKRKSTQLYNPNSRFGMDLIGHAGAALGNVATYANIGAEIRVGWSIPDDFGTASLRPGGDNSTPNTNWSRRNTERDWGVHAFVSFDTRLVLRNIFLDGNSFENSHSVDKEPLVADTAAGLSLYYRGARLSYAQIFRSREFKGQGETHSYGSLSLSYILKF